MSVDKVDICVGLNWGDEAKGKIVAHLSKTKNYNFVCRWSGGNNAGHTIYKNGNKYKTHLIPCGIFYNIPSIIGPDCVVNKDAFKSEIDYLKTAGFDTNLIKISPKSHIITNKHIEEDISKYKDQGTTSKGIAPCYRDKYGRTGLQVKDDDFFKEYLWDEKLYGNVLCEGAQGFWLDISHGNYPYTTSSTTMAYGACSLGFPTQLINKIYGATKIYDTRSGTDPLFPESLLEVPELKIIGELGEEYGTTTGRKRKVNWLNLDKLVYATNMSGVTDLIISKVDIIKKIHIFQLFFDNKIVRFDNFIEMQQFIEIKIKNSCKFVKNIIYSEDLEAINI
jgi:adenylosuccinate synthase